MLKWRKSKYFVRSPCEVCGCLTYAEEERGRFFICPVCFWEDDEWHEDPDEPCGGPNHDLSLNQAKQNYKKYGAIEKRLVSHVRSPEPEELPH